MAKCGRLNISMNNLRDLGNVLRNPKALAFVNFLLSHENKSYSITEISEKLGITKNSMTNILKRLRNFITKIPSENYRSKTGMIKIPTLNDNFKTFYVKFKNELTLLKVNENDEN